MRLKKGFTLAEILIVLMVIGVIATMTIPSLMKGVTESQYKTAYKKAYNTIVNLTAMERISGQLPSIATSEHAMRLFSSLNSNLSVKEYAGSGQGYNNGTILNANNYATKITFTSGAATQTFGVGDTNAINYNAAVTNTAPTPWIITEDNIAYAVALPEAPKTTMCKTKLELNGYNTLADIKANACAFIIVDVNGLSKGPNMLDAQTTANLQSTTSLATLTGDQYYIFIGSDGAAAGNKGTTLSGRLLSDLK